MSLGRDGKDARKPEPSPSMVDSARLTRAAPDYYVRHYEDYEGTVRALLTEADRRTKERSSRANSSRLSLRRVAIAKAKANRNSHANDVLHWSRGLPAKDKPVIGVYAWRIDMKVVYVGSSVDVRKRYFGHIGTPWFRWIASNHDVRFYWAETIDYVETERTLIAKYQPVLNRAGMSPPAT